MLEKGKHKGSWRRAGGVCKQRVLSFAGALKTYTDLLKRRNQEIPMQ
jgi:hypothetical protein